MTSLSSETQSSLSQAMIDFLNNNNLPVGTTRTFQVPCELPSYSWYVITVSRALSDTYVGIAHSIYDNKVYSINGNVGLSCEVSQL